MHALIDGDIFAYEFGSSTDDRGNPLAWPLVQARVDSRIEGILAAVGAETNQIYLTAEDKSNFRIEVASIRPYKGHRATDKPHWYKGIREFLVEHRAAEVVSGYEADDALSIAQCGSIDSGFAEAWCHTVICSRDKDLHMVPGWHYGWQAGNQKEQPLWWQDEIGGLRCFYKQLLTGDSTDNIPGLYGVGRTSAHVKRIDSLDSELDMYSSVKHQYELRFGFYWPQFLYENAKLLWMLRSENVHEVTGRLDGLEDQLEKELEKEAL